MKLEDFEAKLTAISEGEELTEFCRLHLLHGTPFVFQGRDAAFYSFKQRICAQYGINHTEVFIVGSGKLGFSPMKKTEFSLDSDIDVAIVSPALWEHVSDLGLKLEYRLRASEVSFHKHQWKKYHDYLRYGALGWVRPDLIPQKPPMVEFKQQWFDFFNSLSNDRSEVGNYEVTAGLFRSQTHLEEYITDSLRKIRKQLEVQAAS